MAHMGWADPKTAIRYVQKSKQSAFQMAMYLINAQRSNMNQDDLFKIPKAAPDFEAVYLPTRVMPPVATSLLSNFSDLPASASSSSVLSSSDSPQKQDSVVSNFDVKIGSVVCGVEAPNLLTSVGEEERVIPVNNVDNVGIVKSVESCLSGLVGSIANTGVINFNIQFVTK